MSATPGKIRDVEDDKVLSEKETSEFVIVEQEELEEEHEEEFGG